MKNVELIFEKSKMPLLVAMFAIFFVSCSSDESVENPNPDAKTELENKVNTKRASYHGTIVRDWGWHNIDCSAPQGFCHYFVFKQINYFKSSPDGTPARVTNERGNFVIEVQKSALTEQHKKVLLQNGSVYVIPEGQTIVPELVKSLKFSSEVLVPGKYPILESEETYTIAISVK
jgi:hypothetical protein